MEPVRLTGLPTKRGVSRKANGEAIRTTLEQADEAVALEKTRKDLVDARVQFEDDRCLQKQRDSDSRAWCKPVTRELQLDSVQSFYKAMHDEMTLEIEHCVVCGLQKTAKDLEEYMWEEFYGLYVQVEPLLRPSERDHFQCRQCFPRNNANIPICHDCEEAIQRKRLPRACQVNMLQLKCQHRYPKELADLSPLEERLIGLHQPCGWITKFQIDLKKGTSGRYRKLKKGHVTVFPNDVQGLCSNEHLQSWRQSCPGTLVPQALFEAMVPYEHTTEDITRTSHYVPSAERGGADQPTLTAEEVLAQLEDRENSLVQVEAESNARLGTVYSRGLEENEMSAWQIEREVTELTSTGLMGTEMEGEYSVQERLRQLRTMLGDIGPRDNQRRADFHASNTLVAESNRPFIANRRGEAFADSNEGDFFPKTFPCLFPWGTGGPKNMTLSAEEELPLNDIEDGYDIETQRSKNSNFSLRSWARFLLRRHGK